MVFVIGGDNFFPQKGAKSFLIHDETILRQSIFCAGVHFTKTNFGVLAFAVAVETNNILH
jgi:hypothetical protein